MVLHKLDVVYFYMFIELDAFSKRLFENKTTIEIFNVYANKKNFRGFYRVRESTLILEQDNIY